MLLLENVFEQLLGVLRVTRYQDYCHPPSLQSAAIDIRAMTVKELGDVAEARGVTLLDILTL